MAAVLCNGIGKLCSGTCDALGSILSLPCKACGVVCKGASKALKSPFCLYLTVAFGLNIPPVIFAVEAFTSNGGGGCDAALNWLLVNAVLCVVNIAAAMYISAKIAYVPANEMNAVAPAPPASDVEAGSDVAPKEEATKKSTMWPTLFEESNTRAKSLSRVRDVLCHDPIVAIYIIIGIVYIVWQTMGVGRVNGAAACGGGLDNLISDALMFGFLFISLGAMSFSCSVCCLR